MTRPARSLKRSRSLPSKIPGGKPGAIEKKRPTSQPSEPVAPPAAPRAICLANRHPRLRLDRAAVAHAIQVLDTHAAQFRGGAPAGELSLVFLTDPALARLHADFLDDPTVTDVITFEGDSAFGTAGEICVSVDAARRHCFALGAARSTPRFSTELTLYVVHGWLHLAGYDDLQPAKKRAMRRAEARAMELLRRGRCIPGFAFTH